MKMKNSTLAIPAIAEAMPIKPNIPAAIAKMKNNNAQPSIGITCLFVIVCCVI